MAKKKSSKKKKAARRKKVAAGLAAVTAAAIGAYFLTGERGKKTRKKAKGWMLKFKGEVLEQLEKTGEVTEEKYQEVVDRVVAQYKKLKKVDEEELLRLAAELKRDFEKVSTTAAGAAKKVRKAAKQASKQKKSSSSGRKSSSRKKKGSSSSKKSKRKK